MAKKTEEKRIEQEFDKVVGKLTANLQANIKNINQARDELLVNAIKSAGVGEADLTALYGTRFTDFKKTDGSDYTPTEIDQKVSDFIQREMSIDDKLRILSRHTNENNIDSGDDKFSADLADTQKIKAANKKTYKEQAEQIISYMQKIVEDNLAKISNLEAEIEKDKEELRALRAKKIEGPGKFSTMGANGNIISSERTEEDVKKEQEQKNADIKALEDIIKDKTATLTGLRDAHNLYVAELAKRKNEIQEMLNKGKIFSGAEQQGQTQEQTESENRTNGNSGQLVLGSPKEQARAMIKDFYRERTPEQQKIILAQCGSKDFLRAAKHAGLINKLRIKATLRDRIDEMDEGMLKIPDGRENLTGVTVQAANDLLTNNPGQEQFTFGAITLTRAQLQQELAGRNPADDFVIRGTFISKEELKKSKLSDTQIKAAKKYIKEFMENIKTKSPSEIREFENTIQYLRFSTYLQETKFWRKFTSAIDFMMPKTRRIAEISTSLADYASDKVLKEKNAFEREDKWRATLGLGKINPLSRTNPNALDRTGQDALLQQDYTPYDDGR